jgi:hypothetical protein
MVAKTRSPTIFVVVSCVALGATMSNASAISAELAKRCLALTAKAFPPRVIGNPAAGSAKGSGRDQQAYYQKCTETNAKNAQ